MVVVYYTVMKPLFVPLKKQWFLAFERGEKTVEYRRGKRWNERTCAIGRPVVLSLGYSGRRLIAVISKFVRRRDGSVAIHLRDIRAAA